MKKFYSFMTMVAIAAMSFTFNSCTDDDYIAEDLSGFLGTGKTWQGTIDHYYYDRWGLQGDYYITTMYFESGRSTTSGYGYEVDYDTRYPYRDYAYSEFEWSVRNGTITLRYDDNDWQPIYIYDYSLNANYFRGYMDNGYREEIYFDMRRISDYDWDYYRGYYAKGTRSSNGEQLRHFSKGVFAKKQQNQ